MTLQVADLTGFFEVRRNLEQVLSNNSGTKSGPVAGKQGNDHDRHPPIVPPGPPDAHLQGQRQKLLIARALYKQPDIIFFDESTCHLDAISEKNINSSIKKMGITRIMVAHRDETIKLADRVIDIDEISLPEHD